MGGMCFLYCRLNIPKTSRSLGISNDELSSPRRDLGYSVPVPLLRRKVGRKSGNP